jgi:FixJ family two-component response regulator
MAQLNILLIDDDVTVHKAVKFRLRRIADLTSCLNGQEALASVGARKFDVALVDVKLEPGLSGTGLIPRLHEIDPDLTPIIFTAHANYKTAIDSIEAHSFDFIPKSLQDDGQFLAKIQAAAARTRGQRERTSSQSDANLLRGALAETKVDNELKITSNDIQHGLMAESLESFSALLGRVELMDARLKERGATGTELAGLIRLSEDTVAELRDYVGKLREYFIEPARAGRSVNEVLSHAIRIVRDSFPAIAQTRQIECKEIHPDRLVPDDGRALLRAIVVLLHLALKSAPSGASVQIRASVVLNPKLELDILKGHAWARILHAPHFVRNTKTAVAVEIFGPAPGVNPEGLARLFSPSDVTRPGTLPWVALAMVARLNGALVVETKAGSAARYRIIFQA